MSRKLKVAADTQVVYEGNHYFAGDTFSAENDDAEVDGWIERGYAEATAKGGRDMVRKNQRKRVEEHRTAKAPGLDPQGIDGRGPAPPVTQEELAREHSDRFSKGLSRT